MIYFCMENKRSQTLANPLMLHSQRIRYPLMTNGVATFRTSLPSCLSHPPVSEYLLGSMASPHCLSLWRESYIEKPFTLG